MEKRNQISVIPRATGKRAAKINPEVEQPASERKRPTRPFSDAVHQLITEDPTRPRKAAAAVFEKAFTGDLRAFTTLREMVEGKASKHSKAEVQQDATPKYEDVSVIEVRILELLQRSPQLLARLDAARNTDIPSR